MPKQENMSPPSKTQVRERLYQWHLRLTQAFLALTPQQEAEFESWQDESPRSSAEEWPGWIPIIGKRPGLASVLQRTTEWTSLR